MICYTATSFNLTATAVQAGATLTYAWTQSAGPGSCLFRNPGAATVSITAPTDGAYSFDCAVSDGTVTNHQVKTVTVLPYYSSTQSYTATCFPGLSGPPMTRSASATSLTSQSDADSQALAAAVLAASTALRCDPNEGFVGWRMVIPSLANFSSGTLSGTFQLTLRLARLTAGTPNLPVSIQYLTTLIFNNSNLPANNLVDLSTYLASNPGTQTFYLWPQLQLVLNGVSYTQLPSKAIQLDYATPVGTITGQTVRFRDVESAFTTYQGYASAYALTITNTALAAVQMTLDLANSWDTFSLNLHGWDDMVFGAKPGRGYSSLVLSSLSGTISSPLRQRILNVSSPAYNRNDPYDFALNRLSFSSSFDGAAQSATYLLRRVRIGADDALVYDATETGFRFETSANSLDYSTPSLSLPGSTISAVNANSSANIVAGSNVAVTFTPFPGSPGVVAFPIPRFTLSSFKWRLPLDPYSHVVVVQITGTPSVPTGVVGQYAFPLGDPGVLDGPNNLFLWLQGFDTVLNATTFTPFTAVFYSAVFNAQTQVYVLYPNSFPILNNPRTVSSSPTYTVSNFAGYQTLPASANGAVSFSGVFAYSETLYNARCNGGSVFSL